MILNLLIASLLTFSNDSTAVMEIEKDEYWWGCLSNEGYRMPYSKDTETVLDLYGYNGNNQAQPFLISSSGRYIWSEKPFRVTFTDGSILIDKNDDKIHFEQKHSSLKEGFMEAANLHFPSDGRIPDKMFFIKPQYNTWIELMYEQTEEGILEYAENILRHGFPPGILMIDDNWQEDYGVWEFSASRFKNPKSMVDKLHKMGFKVMLWVAPFVSPDCLTYRELRDKGYLICDRPLNTMKGISRQASMINWWNGVSAHLDFSNPKAVEWFHKKLRHLQEEYGIDGFKFDGGDSHFFKDQMVTFSHRTPNEHTEDYAGVGLEYPLNEYRASWKSAGLPLVQRLSDKNHSWADLQKLIPNSIAQGLLGYAYICPDMIGGGAYKTFLNPDNIDQELIVRSAQTHALMPMMQFSVAPWRILDKKYRTICRNMAELHTSFGELFLALANESSHTGVPILRPMCWKYPGTEKINDQFMIGEDLIVAPVITKDTYKRSVFIPEGIWVSDTGETISGPVTIETEVPIERLPYYSRKNKRMIK